MTPPRPIARYGVVAASTLLTLAFAALGGAVTTDPQDFDRESSGSSIMAFEDGIAVDPEELLGIDGLMPPIEASSTADLESKPVEQMFVTAPEPATAITFGLGLSLLAQQARRAGRLRRRQLDHG